MKSLLAVATVIALVLGPGSVPAAAEDPRTESEMPRNRLSPTDDTELPQRAAPPLAPPHRLIPRRITEPQATEPPRASLSRTAPKRSVAHRMKPRRVAVPPPARQRRTLATRPNHRDDTSLGALFTTDRARALPGLSPEAAPSMLTYGYFGSPPAPGSLLQHRTAPTCATASRDSLGDLFACISR